MDGRWRRGAPVVLVAALVLVAAVVAPWPGTAPAGASDRFPRMWPDEIVTLLERAVLPGTTPPTGPPPITYDGAADARIVTLARATDYRERPLSAVARTGVAGVVLNGEAADALVRMRAAAGGAGAPFTAVSGYRSPDDQRRIFLDALAVRGRAAIGRPYTNAEIASGAADASVQDVLRLNSIPGFSLHHTGDAVDLTAPGGTLDGFAASAAYRWLSADNYANAKAFGFVPSYPVGAGAIGPEPEPWEFTYVGLRNLTCAANLLTLADTTPGRCPVGTLDLVVVDGTRVTALGWAADPDSPGSPTTVHVWVDEAILPVSASVPRPDVGAVTPYGPNHGFEAGMDLAPGAHTVCAFALNDVSGEDNTWLGCTVVTVRTRQPVGALDRVAPEGTGLRVEGWAADPDRPGEVLSVHLWVDGVAVAVPAGLARPDVDAATPYGSAHGYSAWLAVPDGAHTVCAYAISPQAGEGNPRLGCRTATALGTDPVGSLDRVVAEPGRVRFEGWALDAQLPATALDVHLYLDGTFAGTTVADRPRPDVDGAFALGPAHGFSGTVAASPGAHTGCAFAIAATAGEPHRYLGCRTVVVAG